jgi:flagellar hook protein FlgE
MTIANFAAETELFRDGNSLFIETARSGQPIYSVPNVGTNGTVAASTLELSNVDLTEEFVRLITTQRAFQANTKTVMTSDEMLETVIQMKR